MPEIKSVVFSLLLVFTLSLFLFPFYIRWQEKNHIGQKIKKEGPNLHLYKENTPSMGGVIIILSGLLVLSFFEQLTYPIKIILVTLLSFGGLGWVDDYFKSFQGKPWSLKARHKFLLELVFSVFILILGFPLFPHYLMVPYGDGIIELGKIPFFLYSLFLILASTNAFNITDGLDGLAGGCGILTFAFWAGLFFWKGDFSLARIAAIFAGALLSFLWFNFWPARIFMGDCGSLSLGALMGVLALFSGYSWILALAGVVYVLDTLSVILQVFSFRVWGKRIFLMSPLHHHFELRGEKESKITIRFWIIQGVGVIAAILGIVR